jgi:hypothetical protein
MAVPPHWWAEQLAAQQRMGVRAAAPLPPHNLSRAALDAQLLRGMAATMGEASPVITSGDGLVEPYTATAPDLTVVRTPEMPDESWRIWTVELGAITRKDGQPLIAPPVPTIGGPGGNVTAPVTLPANGAPMADIRWGVGGATHRLLADWPVRGGSIAVPGSYVEVHALMRNLLFGTEPDGSPLLPVYTATIAPGGAGGGALDLAQLFEVIIVPFAADLSFPVPWWATAFRVCELSGGASGAWVNAMQWTARDDAGVIWDAGYASQATSSGNTRPDKWLEFSRRATKLRFQNPIAPTASASFYLVWRIGPCC